jgi:hypothetical protein
MTQSQYVTAVEVGGGAFVGGIEVLVAGTGVAPGIKSVGVGDGATWVIALIVCETMA